MLSANNKIGLRQFQILIFLDIFGVGVIPLPRLTAEQAGQDGWICAAFATLIVIVFAVILCGAASINPRKNFTELAAGLLSKPVAIVIAAVFAIKLTANCAMRVRVFGEIMRVTALKTTPTAAVCAVMLLVAAYAAVKGYETRARAAEILSAVTVIPLIITIVLSVPAADFTNLLPVAVSSSPASIGRGTLTAVFAFKGIELILLAYPYLTKHEKALPGVIKSVALTGGLMTGFTALTIARFGIYDIKSKLWPFLEMMSASRFPGSYFDRADIAMISFLVISVFAAVNAYLFFAMTLLRDITSLASKDGVSPGASLIIPVAGIAYVFSFLPKNVTDAAAIDGFFDMTAGTALVIVVPALMLISAAVRKLAAGSAG